MLAFTVQFSRYGRNQTYYASHPGRGSAWPCEVSALTKRLLPQDPTACSLSQDYVCSFRKHRRSGKRTGRVFDPVY